jgi:hypothetical protein
MKLALCVFAILCFSAATGRSQNEKLKPRVIDEPKHFYTAGEFIEMSEVNRMVYTSGLMDGFFASGLFGASDETVVNLNSCTRDMGMKQLSAIITKYINDHPESWHLALSAEGFNALNTACPGTLKIVNKK